MSVGNALTTAISGLRTSQAGMALVGQNVANADNPGYTRKTLVNQTKVIGEQVVGVRSTTAQRTLDTLLQSTLRTEIAGGTYTDLRARYTERLEALYGVPGTDTALDAAFAKFTGTLQELASSPENPITRARAVSEGVVFSQRVNGIAEDIQALRLEAEQGLGDAVARANDALQRISEIDKQIIAGSGGGRNPVNLQDQRDAAIKELANLMDIRVDVNADNSVAVFTRSGVLLYDREPVVLDFDQRATLSPQSIYDKNPTKRGVGTITMRAPNGFSIDLIAQGAFRSGEIAALVSLRDDVLVDAQAQLDEFAAGLSQALSDRTVAGVPAGAAPQTGFDIDVSQMRPGDVITLNVVQGGIPRTVSIVRVDDASALPLPASATPNPTDQVIGIPFSGGSAAAAAILQTALGAAFAVSSPVAGTLRVLDDGAAGTTDVTAASARVTEGSLTGGTAALPFFVDAGGTQPIYSGSFDGGSQKIGYSMRMAVNDALQNDPSRTVLMTPTTLAGDATRPNGMLERINKTSRTFAGVDGIGSADAPPSATVVSYLKRLISAQGQQAETERRMSEGQEIVVNGLQDRFDAGARVNIDEEMARLIELQQTYQASARIISIVDEMMRVLLQS